MNVTSKNGKNYLIILKKLMIKHPNLKESEIQSQIISWLEYQKCLVIRLQNIGIPLKDGGFRPVRKKGLPDLIVFIKRKKGYPIPIFLEIKSAKGRVSPEQEAFLADADSRGIICFIARSLDFVQDSLKKYFI